MRIKNEKEALPGGVLRRWHAPWRGTFMQVCCAYILTEEQHRISKVRDYRHRYMELKSGPCAAHVVPKLGTRGSSGSTPPLAPFHASSDLPAIVKKEPFGVIVRKQGKGGEVYLDFGTRLGSFDSLCPN